jgi:hypothetical protein
MEDGAMSFELQWLLLFLAVLIVGIAIDEYLLKRKGDNGMRRRMTDRRMKKQMGWRSQWDRIK